MGHLNQRQSKIINPIGLLMSRFGFFANKYFVNLNSFRVYVSWQNNFQ